MEAETGFWPTGKIVAPTNTDGVVIWRVDTNTAPPPFDTPNIIIHFSVYDPKIGAWRDRNEQVSSIDFLARNPTSKNGIVHWATAPTGSSSTPDIRYLFRVYDPNVGSWIATDLSRRSDSTHGLGAALIGDGVAAWLVSEGTLGSSAGVLTVESLIFNIQSGTWIFGQRSHQYSTFTPVTLDSITSGTVNYTFGGVQYTHGYNFASGASGWGSGITVPLSYFLPSQTTGTVPLKIYFWDMSLGGASWSWSFGDGGTSTVQSLFYTYSTAAGTPYTATQTVTGPGGSNASNRIITPTTPHAISGNSANLNGFKIPGATVTLSGTISRTTQTDANGNYAFTNLTANGNYTVSIAKNRYGFTPVNRTFNNLSGSQTGNFTGKLNDKPSDFDGDGKSDISIFRPGTGNWWIINSSDSSIGNVSWGVGTDVVTPRDFDGDGKTDFAVWRPSNGTWYVVRSSDSTSFTVAYGVSGDIPASNDYDGDDKADYAVYRPSDQTWYVRRSSDSQFSVTQFGVSGDIPVSGDYDGDEKADLAVFRPSDSSWYSQRTSSGYIVEQFGQTGDKIVQGDYDGDAKTDLATFRPSDLTWRVKRSSNGVVQSQSWGEAGDILAPGDFDGDGKHDYVIFRPSTFTWYVFKSSDSGYYSTTFGQNGDYPTPTSYIPN